jgi:hypothetical protein
VKDFCLKEEVSSIGVLYLFCKYLIFICILGSPHKVFSFESVSDGKLTRLNSLETAIKGYTKSIPIPSPPIVAGSYKALSPSLDIGQNRINLETLKASSTNIKSSSSGFSAPIPVVGSMGSFRHGSLGSTSNSLLTQTIQEQREYSGSLRQQEMLQKQQEINSINLNKKINRKKDSIFKDTGPLSAEDILDGIEE